MLLRRDRAPDGAPGRRIAACVLRRGLAPAGRFTGGCGPDRANAMDGAGGDGLGLDVCGDLCGAPGCEGISDNSNRELTRRGDDVCIGCFDVLHRVDYLLIPIGIAFMLIMGALCLVLLIKIWRNEINLCSLLEEANGQASMSRFQLLIFTLVVAVGVFLAILHTMTLPNIPNSILTLLGISASTYAAGKGISFSRPEGVLRQSAPVAPPAVVADVVPPADHRP